MFEKKPITIFTDQDAAMSLVIKVVMPKTYHIGQLLLHEVSSRWLDLMGSGAYSHLCYWAFIETLIFYKFSLFFLISYCVTSLSQTKLTPHFKNKIKNKKIHT